MARRGVRQSIRSCSLQSCYNPRRWSQFVRGRARDGNHVQHPPQAWGWGRWRVVILRVVGGHEVSVWLEHDGIETTQEGEGHRRIPPREGDRLRQGMPRVGGVRGLVPQGGVAQLCKGGGGGGPHGAESPLGCVESPRPTPSLDIAPPCLDRDAALSSAASAGWRFLRGGNSPWRGRRCGPCARACGRSTIRQILAIAAVVIYFASEASTSSNLSPSNAAIHSLVAARLYARLRCISSNSTINTINIVHCLKGLN